MAPRISLCVIARDEGDLLPGCLASVVGAVDEVIVVDTGSADDTARLARQRGARVAEIAWEDDFSAARNASLALATGDFVLVLDADERLAPGAAARLRAALVGARFDCGTVRLHNAARLDASPAEVISGAARLGAPIALPRVLRRAPDLRYTGVVHESVSDWLASRGMRVASLDLDVLHLGAEPSLRDRRGKRERNLSLLRRRCALEPDRVTPFGYLALELISHGQLAEAREVAARGWALVPAQPPGVTLLRLAVARAIVAVEDGAPDVALDAISRAERVDGPGPDLFHLRGRALTLAAPRGDGDPGGGALDGAEAAFRAALRFGGDAARREYVAGASSWASWSGLGETFLTRGRAAAALDAFGEALAHAPADPEASLGQAEALLASQPARALALLERHLDSRPDGWILASAAARALGATDDARHLARQALARHGNKPWSRRRANSLARLAREVGAA